jgi:glyoxylase-like metal-dependent hydrolase (beta-lactamase superfamily II)
MEIAPQVHAVPLIGAIGHVVFEDRLTLIDTGLPGSGQRLGSYLAAHGRGFGDIQRIVCTHAHPDHVGGINEIVRRTNGRPEVLIHPADAAGLNVTLRGALRRPSRGRALALISRKPAYAESLQDGQVIDAIGGLHVVHTPGHTPGSVCFYAPRDGLLFVGDMFERKRNRLTYASRIWSDNVRQARASVQRLAELDVKTIVLAHDPPWREDANAVLRELAGRVMAG